MYYLTLKVKKKNNNEKKRCFENLEIMEMKLTLENSCFFSITVLQDNKNGPYENTTKKNKPKKHNNCLFL